MNDLQTYRNQVDGQKRDIYILKQERDSILSELEKAKKEIQRMKIKKACGNCSAGCAQSEVTGLPCSPK